MRRPKETAIRHSSYLVIYGSETRTSLEFTHQGHSGFGATCNSQKNKDYVQTDQRHHVIRGGSTFVRGERYITDWFLDITPRSINPGSTIMISCFVQKKKKKNLFTCRNGIHDVCDSITREKDTEERSDLERIMNRLGFRALPHTYHPLYYQTRQIHRLRRRHHHREKVSNH